MPGLDLTGRTAIVTGEVMVIDGGQRLGDAPLFRSGASLGV